MTIPDTPAGDALLSLIWDLFHKQSAGQRAQDRETQIAAPAAEAERDSDTVALSIVEAAQTSGKQSRRKKRDRETSP